MQYSSIFIIVTMFCCQVLSLETLTPTNMPLAQVYETESICTKPILFVITPGADPSSALREVAMKVVGEKKYRCLAMGQGQGDIAISLIRASARTGEWVCLLNIHLVIAWVKLLEQELDDLKPHPDFRLWLTSEAHMSFSPTFLSNCLKITVETPPGISKNMKIIYDQWGADYILSGSVMRAQSLFILAWFHAVIQERRNFIPQGWNKFYEFSAADLRSAAELLTVNS